MKKIIPIMLILLIILTGCSSGPSGSPLESVTVEWKDGVIYYDGEATALTSYNGVEAEIENGNGGLNYTFLLDNATDVTSISVNTQNILEENMDKLGKKFYYTEYLGSQFTMAASLGSDYWNVCRVSLSGEDSKLVATYASDYIDTFMLTIETVYCDFGPFKLGADGYTTEVRTDCALIESIIKVSKNTYDCPNTYTVTQGDKEYLLQKGESKNYDYYMYEGYLIQSAKGIDISMYIDFD